MQNENTAKTLELAYLKYIRENTNEPEDWRAATQNTSFAKTQTNLGKYIVYRFEKSEREGFHGVVISYYGIQEKSKSDIMNTLAASSKPKTLSKVYDETDLSTRKIDTLEFLAHLFDIKCKTFEEFKQHYQKVTPKTTTNFDEQNFFAENTPSFTAEKDFTNPLEVRFAPTAVEEDKTIAPQRNFKQKTLDFLRTKNVRRNVVFSVIVLISCLFLFAQQKKMANENAAKMANFEQKEKYVEAIFLTHKNVSDQLLDEEMPAQNQVANIAKSPISHGNSVSFHTHQIHNQDFVKHKKGWNFELDKKGEDILGEYGEPILKSMQGVTISQFTTIANREMTIRFNLNNESNKKYYVSQVKIVLKKSIEVPFSEVIIDKWSNLKTKSQNEKVFDFVLNENAHNNPLSTSMLLIAPQELKYFALNLQTNPQNTKNRILAFELEITLNDGNGTAGNMVLKSDKLYKIGNF